MIRLAATILALSVLALLGCDQNSASTDQRTDVDYSAPLSITLDNEGDFADGSSWTLTVNPDRAAVLDIRTFPNPKTRALEISPKQMAALRSTLESERFFSLAGEYGELVPSGSTQTIIVKCGDDTKRVELHFLMNWVHNDPLKLTEPARAVRVWRHVRQWFADKDAVDLGRYDQMVLDAVANR